MQARVRNARVYTHEQKKAKKASYRKSSRLKLYIIINNSWRWQKRAISGANASRRRCAYKQITQMLVYTQTHANAHHTCVRSHFFLYAQPQRTRTRVRIMCAPSTIPTTTSTTPRKRHDRANEPIIHHKRAYSRRNSPLPVYDVYPIFRTERKYAYSRNDCAVILNTDARALSASDVLTADQPTVPTPQNTHTSNFDNFIASYRRVAQS